MPSSLYYMVRSLPILVQVPQHERNISANGRLEFPQQFFRNLILAAVNPLSNNALPRSSQDFRHIFHVIFRRFRIHFLCLYLHQLKHIGP